MDVAFAITLLIFAPAILALGYAVYSMVKFILSRRNVSLKNELIVGALGIFSVFFPKLMTSESKRYFTHFLLAAGFFCLYSTALMFVAHMLL